MGFAKIRLAVASLAFVGWLGFLGYLVFRSRDLEVLSRPQFLNANLHVIASLAGSEKPETKGKLTEIVWSAAEADAKLVGSEIAIQDLDAVTAKLGWEGAGEYIVPLARTKTGYRLAPIPPSPGYGGNMGRIYRVTPETREQLSRMPRAK